MSEDRFVICCYIYACSCSSGVVHDIGRICKGCIWGQRGGAVQRKSGDVNQLVKEDRWLACWLDLASVAHVNDITRRNGFRGGDCKWRGSSHSDVSLGTSGCCRGAIGIFHRASLQNTVSLLGPCPNARIARSNCLRNCCCRIVRNTCWRVGKTYRCHRWRTIKRSRRHCDLLGEGFGWQTTWLNCAFETQSQCVAG